MHLHHEPDPAWADRAAERTYAAWLRTGLFALASGIGARALLTGVVPDPQNKDEHYDHIHVRIE